MLSKVSLFRLILRTLENACILHHGLCARAAITIAWFYSRASLAKSSKPGLSIACMSRRV